MVGHSRTMREREKTRSHQVEPQLQSLVHHLLGLAVVLVLVLPPVGDDLLHLAVQGGEQTLPLLVLALQAGQHQGQEGLLAQQGHAAKGERRDVSKPGINREDRLHL